MFRKLLLHVVLVLGLIGLLQNQARAWSLTTYAGIGFGNSYYLYFEVKGGGSPSAMEGTFVSGTLYVLDATLVCSNPGTNQLDVRGGQGGTTLIVNTPLNDTTLSVDERGRFILQSDRIFSERNEITDPSPYSTAQAYFNAYWGIDSSDCKSSDNWDPYAYLLQKVWLTGTLWKNCYDAGPDPPPYDSTTCTDGGSVELYCETLEDPKYWPGLDGEVHYTCVERGSPIAWDDNYSVRKNKKLIVSAPGVLDNDSDAEGDPLKAILNHNVSHGTLGLNDDGSFTYIPTVGFVGEDTFTYKANDLAHDSNEAKVTITVYP